MTDEMDGPLHLTLDADVRLKRRGRFGAATPAQLEEVLADLIRRLARSAGVELTDPRSVRVRVTPAG
jgi:D-serine deaminase-like pyridoxal phosphate-dependent protein